LLTAKKYFFLLVSIRIQTSDLCCNCKQACHQLNPITFLIGELVNKQILNKREDEEKDRLMHKFTDGQMDE
jgi:hypothetical protein